MKKGRNLGLGRRRPAGNFICLLLSLRNLSKGLPLVPEDILHLLYVPFLNTTDKQRPSQTGQRGRLAENCPQALSQLLMTCESVPPGLLKVCGKPQPHLLSPPPQPSSSGLHDGSDHMPVGISSEARPHERAHTPSAPLQQGSEK